MPRPAAAPAVEARIAHFLKTLSLEEKIGQLSQRCIVRAADVEIFAEPVRRGTVGSFILCPPPEESVEVRNRLQRLAAEESRSGVPLVFAFDTIHGYRTVVPIPLALACTWDAELVEAVQQVAGRESRAAGIDWVFAPMCDIALDVRWGRVAETFGEDPTLNAAMVAASVRGLQGGAAPAPGQVAATLKHFVGYGATYAGREYNETWVSLFSLRNLHLPPFAAGVAAGASTVMSSFNANDGIPGVADRWALSGVLREEWGFAGPVVSDWESVQEMIAWGYVETRREAAEKSLAAGNDIEMVSSTYEENLQASIAEGRVTITDLDSAVERVLRLKFALGLFDKPYTPGEPLAPLNSSALALAKAREAACKSAVLLKNDGVLPLSPALKRVALLGPLADDAGEMLGTWPGWGDPAQVVSLADGLRAATGDQVEWHVERGVSLLGEGARTRAWLDGTVRIEEEDTANTNDEDEWRRALAAAEASEVVVLALGEPRGWSGENASRTRLDLPGRQQAFLKAVAGLGKPTVLVLFSGRPLVVTALVPLVSALLQFWHPGVQAGTALADLLLGRTAPSGRLAISFPQSLGQVPSSYSHLRTGRPHMWDYKEESRGPLFPFGFGLTYTKFEYGIPYWKAGPSGSQAGVAAVLVRNAGPRFGRVLVQLYIGALACSEGARPRQELRDWQSHTLAPEEEIEVEFALTWEKLSFWTRAGQRTVEAVSHEIWVADHAGIGTPLKLPADWVATLLRNRTDNDRRET